MDRIKYALNLPGFENLAGLSLKECQILDGFVLVWVYLTLNLIFVGLKR